MSEPTIPLRPVPGAKFVSPQGTRAIKDGVKDAAGKFTMNPYSEKLSAEEMQALVPFVRGLKK